MSSLPQTDTLTATTDFNGSYVAGWQIYNNGSEFDMISQGSMAPGGSLSLTGLVSDPFFSQAHPTPQALPILLLGLRFRTRKIPAVIA